MKKLVFITIAMTVFQWGVCQKYEKNKLNENEYELEKVLKSISVAIQDAILDGSQKYSSGENVLAYLDNVSVNFSNAVTKTIGGEVSVIVFSGKASRSKQKTKSISYSFNTKNTNESISELDKSYLITSTDIKADLLSIGTCLEKYKNLPYQLSEIQIELGVEITKAGEGGMGFKVSSFDLGASAARSKATGNTISLTFKMPK